MPELWRISGPSGPENFFRRLFMKRLNVMIENDAKSVIDRWQDDHGFATKDEATTDFILKNNPYTKKK